MLPSPGAVILELTLEPDRITSVNIEKWGSILNYSYIPRIRRMPDASGYDGAVRGKRCQGIHVPVLSPS